MIKIFSKILEKIFLRDRKLITITIVSLGINIATWLVLWRAIQPSDMIILHYTTYFGPDLLGEWYRVFLLPMSGMIILCVNIIFCAFSSNRLMNYFLILSQFLCQIFISIAAFCVILQNI